MIECKEKQGRILAIKNHEGLCWKCLKTFHKSQVHEIKIPALGYGSQFDEFSTEVHLCNDCFSESIKHNSELWNMKKVEYKFCRLKYSAYKHEEAMLDYINNLPIQAQQFVYNEFCSDQIKDKPQDWIDKKIKL